MERRMDTTCNVAYHFLSLPLLQADIFGLWSQSM